MSTTNQHLFRRTTTTLSDGRELIYFDDSATPPRREAADLRGLTAVEHGGELRWDARVGQWVALAAHRSGRPHLPGDGDNPLAPTRAGRSTEIPADDYDVVVFENRFPSFAGLPGDETVLDGEPLWPRRPAAGRCEVLCFSPDPAASLGDLGPSRMRTVIEAWADRTRELARLAGVAQVFCFENRGAEVGVTLPHPHGQIYAYPFLPPDTVAVLEQSRRHRATTGRNLLDDLLAAELRSGRRIVAEGEHWVAYVPAAARWPVELEIAPRRHVPDLCALTDSERAELAEFYPGLLRRLDRFFTGADGAPLPLPYVSAWHQAPVHVGRDEFRLHLRLFSVRRAADKIKYLAGSESAMGVWITDTTPEAIADRLRELAP
ncbi:galactose-1-phosphate uridylyltransferase [Tomitella biformata]|uniref:galactose-1-phosphate uridylyltransferase n=1 Tax=Tomitella biformata TaxID=630403 RepID=UPI001F212789|nr:galactose-1-phosphate uridylyltransferase [Tomitella biformata]